MNETKSIWTSKTVWGGIVALTAGIAGIWGYSVSVDDQAAIVELATGVAAALGGAGAIVGRIVASKKVTP